MTLRRFLRQSGLSLALALTPLAAVGGCATATTAQTAPEGYMTTTNAPDAPWATSESLTALCDTRLKQAEIIRDHVVAVTEPRDLANTLEPLNAMFAALDPANGWAGLMFNIHPDEALRKTAQSCQTRIADFQTAVGLNSDLFQAVNSVTLDGLEPTARRFAERLLKDFRRAGVDKSSEQRARITEIQKRLTAIGQEYGQNVRTDVRSIQVDPKTIAALPQDFRDAHAPGDDGTVTLTTDYPDFFPVQTYATDETTRAALYKVFMLRGYPANKPLMKELLELRGEMAQILGHPHWASYHAEDKMAGSAETIDAFIKDIASIVRPKAEVELAELLVAKRAVSPKAERIEVWDRFFFTSEVREAKHNFDAREVRPYFPFNQVTRGILDLYGALFGLEFIERKDRAIWHPSVKAYDLRRDGIVIGQVFLDMHSRAGKYKHAAAFDVQTGAPGGRLAIGTLVCNFPNPADGDGKALMEHSDVVTYFHEFGHLIHLLMAQASPWVPLNGFAVEWDFVEAPSQLLEEWAWDPTVLAGFAKHVDTGEAIPAEMVTRMRDAEEFGKGIHLMRQVFYTAYSYYLHAADAKTLDLEAFTDGIYKNYSPYRRIDGGKVYANFAHLLGYSSGYYTYQWSLVIAKDLFTRFAAEGLLNPTVARAYRDAVLAKGGTKPAAELVEDFLGRPYNQDAYKAWLTK